MEVLFSIGDIAIDKKENLKTARRILVTSSDELGAQIFYKKYKREFYWTEKEL